MLANTLPLTLTDVNGEVPEFHVAQTSHDPENVLTLKCARDCGRTDTFNEIEVIFDNVTSSMSFHIHYIHYPHPGVIITREGDSSEELPDASERASVGDVSCAPRASTGSGMVVTIDCPAQDGERVYDVVLAYDDPRKRDPVPLKLKIKVTRKLPPRR